MATKISSAQVPGDTLAAREVPSYISAEASSEPSPLWDWVVTILTPLASLKITVVLFLMAIFIVLAGTLAQVEKDIWQVVHEYFRMDFHSWRSVLASAFAWIDFRIWFPRPFFPNMEPIPWGVGFFFPKGWLIGLCMFINLTAAHLIRFRIQATGSRLVSGLVMTVLGIALGLAVILAGSRQTATQLQLFTDWPSLRILWLLTQCTAVSVALLAGCLLIFRKRGGIVLLHSGIGLLMLGELIVGVWAVEGMMQIVEGQTTNVVMDTREMELAVVRPAGADEDVDEVVAIPESRLTVAAVIDDDPLPFDVEVVEYLRNSEERPANPGVDNRATAGYGLQRVVRETDPISGVDDSQRSNRPAAYVRLLDKQSKKPLGVHLVSLQQFLLGRPETVDVGGQRYDMSLRYRHDYKPYSMALADVSQEVYMGTQTAKSYASELRLVDPTRNVDRRVRIWMNNPLRFAGATFYQSSYGRDPGTQLEYTGLQVVTNTGWRIPYLACMMVAIGMGAQFWVTLQRFQRRRAEGRLSPATADAEIFGAAPPSLPHRGLPPSKGQPIAAPAESSLANWLVPLAIVVLCNGWLLSKVDVPSLKVSEIDYAAFGRLPVTYEGRVKPYDTLARNMLRIISDRQTYRDEDGKQQPAVRWLLDVMTDSEAASQHEVFRIYNLDVLDTLGLEPHQGFRYSIDDFRDKLDEFDQQVKRAHATDSDQRDLYSRKILELDRKLGLYLSLVEAFRVPQLRLEKLSEDLAREGSRRERLSGQSLPLAVPPESGEGEWTAYSFALFDALAQQLAAAQGLQAGSPNPHTVALMEALTSYDDQGQNAAVFNEKVKAYRELLAANPPAGWQATKTDFEVTFNHFAPLYYAMILYFIAFVLGCFSWLGWSTPLGRACTWLTVTTLIVHTLALAGRIYISGRPPVTNLYTSALFISWACVILGLLFEGYSKIGVANVVAAFSGFASLLIAFLLTTAVISFKGDSFTVLVAVLDTNFWLATHVICITCGYSATIFAGMLGIVYVMRGVLTPSLTPAIAKSISRMIYGTVCFAIFFSFFGTVLGGLWADDSWGRFWGWDPKENGALIIVLWNAVVLHALWGRMIADRGLAVLAIVGNIVTAWSWFGVNELRVGLHTYGFTEGVLLVLGSVVLVHVGIISLGLFPLRIWGSSTPRSASAG